MDTIVNDVHDKIPPDGRKNKQTWNPGKDGISKWSKERRLLFLIG